MPIPFIHEVNRRFRVDICDPGMPGRITLEFNDFRKVNDLIASESKECFSNEKSEYRDYSWFDVQVFDAKNPGVVYPLFSLTRFTGYPCLLPRQANTYFLRNEPDSAL